MISSKSAASHDLQYMFQYSSVGKYFKDKYSLILSRALLMLKHYLISTIAFLNKILKTIPFDISRLVTHMDQLYFLKPEY